MKLLVFYPYLPYPLDRGTYHRTFNLLRALALEFEVDLLAMAEHGEGREHIAVFQKFCRKVELIPFQHPPWQKMFPHRLFNPLPPNIAHWTLPHVPPVLEQFLKNQPYDAVHICDIVLAQYFLKKHREIPIAIDRSRVDLQFQWMEHRRMKFPFKDRLLRYEGYAKLWRYERIMADRSLMEIVCGPDDQTFLRRYVRREMPIEVLVNGVDLDFFRPGPADPPRDPDPTLIFCGAMDYNPNIDALRWYFSEMHAGLKTRIPSLKVLVVGKAPVAEVKAYAELPGVTVTGGVPDVRPFYQRAWMQMVPLRIGGGTRLKIVESLAIGTPVVSTTIGAQGLSLAHGQEILLADTAGEFIEQCARGLGDEKLRQSLEENGMKTARDRFSWPTIGARLCQIYRERLKAVPRRTAG